MRFAREHPEDFEDRLDAMLSTEGPRSSRPKEPMSSGSGLTHGEGKPGGRGSGPSVESTHPNHPYTSACSKCVSEARFHRVRFRKDKIEVELYGERTRRVRAEVKPSEKPSQDSDSTEPTNDQTMEDEGGTAHDYGS